MADKAGSPSSGTGSSNLDVDISTPALVAWPTSDTPLEVTFDARRLDSTNDAFFKLRRTLTLKAAPSTKTPLFVFIPPEQIDRLELVEPATAEPGAASHDAEARKRLGSDITCLRFALKRPAVLIGPEDLDLTPKNKASGIVLDSLRSLAHHDSLVVYFARNVVSQARLKSLCEAANNGILKSILRQADLTSLYRGKGGHVITVAGAPVAASNEPDSPPSYDELGPGPPPAPSYESGGKTSSAIMLDFTIPPSVY